MIEWRGVFVSENAYGIVAFFPEKIVVRVRSFSFLPPAYVETCYQGAV